MTYKDVIFLLGYSLITSDGTCTHVNGKFPTYCFSRHVPSQSDCKAFCTSQSSCIGFFHSNKIVTNCYLIPSDTTCPSSFTLYKKDTQAASANDLVAKTTGTGSGQGYVCYVKTSGKMNKPQTTFIYDIPYSGYTNIKQ